jgi:hypothetical protein
LVFTTYFVVLSQPWTGTPDWSAAIESATDVSFSGLAIAALLTVVAALVLHPLQFALVQLLEGYWGTHPIATWAAAKKVHRHQTRKHALGFAAVKYRRRFAEVLDHKIVVEPADLRDWWTFTETDRVRARYPELFEDVMPTRLGNILRRYEARAGAPYGLNALDVVPHVALLAPAGQVKYLQDQRTQLDLATRLCLVTTLLACFLFILLLPAGFWLLLAIVPYLLAYVFYLGACTVAHHYGNAFEVMLDLNRFRLYEALHLPLPYSSYEEREQNSALTRAVNARSPDSYLRYKHPSVDRTEISREG